MPRRQPFTVMRYDASGGLEFTQSDHMLKGTFFRNTLNCLHDVYGALTKREGYTLLDDTDLEAVPAGAHYARTEGGQEEIIVFSGSKLRRWREAIGFSNLETGLLGTEHASMATYRNFVFIATGSNPLKYYDPATGTIVTFAAPTNINAGYTKPKFVDVYQNHLVLANFSDTTPDRSAVFFGNLNKFDNNVNADSWESTKNIVWVGLGRGAGEAITGMAVFAGVLWIFTKTTIEYISGTTAASMSKREYSRGIGCVAPGSIAVGSNSLFFMSDKGPCRIDMNKSLNLIYEPIHPIWTKEYPTGLDVVYEANTDFLQRATGIVYQDRYLLAIPVGLGTDNSLVIVYDQRPGRRNFTNLEMPAGAWLVYKGKLVMFRATDRKMYYALSGATDAGTSIPIKIQPIYGSLDGDVNGKKSVVKMKFDVENSGSSASLRVLVDHGGREITGITIPATGPQWDLADFGAVYDDSDRAVVPKWPSDLAYGREFSFVLTTEDDNPFKLMGYEWHYNSHYEGDS